MAATKNHKVVAGMQPEDPDEKVWRYMAMPVFVDLIESHELHFARFDTLDDPFEGSTTQFNKFMRALGELIGIRYSSSRCK